MLPVATVRDRGPAAGLRRVVARIRAVMRAITNRPSHFVTAWTGTLGLVQAAALCVGLTAQGRPLPAPTSIAIAALALAIIAGLCLGVFLFVRMLGATGHITAVLVTALFYGLCITGSSQPGWLLALALWPTSVAFGLLLPHGPWGSLPARPVLPRA